MEALSTDITDDIKSLNQKFVSCFNQGDTAGVANLYTITALLMPAGSDAVQGREAVGKFWQSTRDNGVTEMTLDTVEVEQLELTAIELGTYTLRGQGHTSIDDGKYMVVWKREHDQWKIQKDIWNSNQTS
ncbi:YybH family protein [Nibribacter koreensis]|uniref:DUF4440 domain-containing protein n=1 Tax=Nibribacter koreensis TaxID=1084519 RepID=A0ABP8FGN9_9BACT